jgi:protein O-mannosyl-transferase
MPSVQKYFPILAIIIAFLLYGNTLNNKYCLDDRMVIKENKFTHKGLSGIGKIFSTESFSGFFGEEKLLVSGARYRPLSIATFAVEYAIFGLNPMISHLINILLYAFTIILIYQLIYRIFKRYVSYSRDVALLGAILFAFHPVHTEVVANIKGRDEILALMFSLWATILYIKYLDKPRWISLFWGTFFWFLALLSKENAFVFIVLIPVLLYLPANKQFKPLKRPLAGMFIAGLLFLFIRWLVIRDIEIVPIQELMNNSFLEASTVQKYATIFYTLGKYIWLLLFPHPLTYDYYPYQIALVNWSNWFALFSLFIFISLAVIAVYFFRKKYWVSVSVLLFIIPLLPVSNLFFPIGTFMSERFIYMSSLGFVLFISFIMVQFINKLYQNQLVKISIYTVFIVTISLYFYKTISRNKAWKDDYTLFTTDVTTSSNSAKSNCSAGGVIQEKADTVIDQQRKLDLLQESKKYLIKAVSIHPTYTDALLLLGNAYFKLGNIHDSAVFYYITILKYNPRNELAISNMLLAAERLDNTDQKIEIYEIVLKNDPDNFLANYKLGLLYGKFKNNMSKSVEYLEKAYSINPGSKEICLDLGVAYGISGNYSQSIQLLERASVIAPNDANVFYNLGITYKNLGNLQKSKEYFDKAQNLRIK